jgi:hypothetical protein
LYDEYNEREVYAMKKNRDILSILLAGAFISVLLVAGCTTANPVRVVPLVGVDRYPPTDPSTIMVLRAEPLRPFKTLGQIVLEPEAALSVPDMEQMLRQAAASMGANAVFITQDMAMQAGVSSAGNQVVSAIAIRFTD